jgi:hypothetical protein
MEVMNEDYIKMIEKNKSLVFKTGAAANIHILDMIQKSPHLMNSKSKEFVLEHLQHKFLTGEA